MKSTENGHLQSGRLDDLDKKCRGPHNLGAILFQEPAQDESEHVLTSFLAYPNILKKTTKNTHTHTSTCLEHHARILSQPSRRKARYLLLCIEIINKVEKQ